MMEKKTRIKLEVGKSYQNRVCGIVRIVDVGNTNELPYLGNDYFAYHEDGSFRHDKVKSNYDLIKEIDMMEKANTTDDTTTTTTGSKGVHEVKYIAIKNSEVSKLEDSLRKHICGLVSIGKYQEARVLLNILIEEEK